MSGKRSAERSEKSISLPLFAEQIDKSWDWARLDSLAEVIDCPHSTPVLTDTGPYIARSQDIRTGVFRTESAGRVSEETYAERNRRAEPTHGDLLYSREGTYFGIAAAIPRHARVCLGQRMVLIRPKQGLDPDFLRYWLNSPHLSRHIHGFRDGSVAERLNLPTIRALPVAFPGIADQRMIAGSLSALDDKIALLLATNATLEAIAQAIFKSWFVDFDPVRAKAEGRDPEGVPPEVADQFPSEFENSELGAIPKGWKIQSFEGHFEVVRGLSYKGSCLTISTDPKGVPMHNLNSVLEGGGYKYAGLKFYNGEFKEKHQIRAGDLIVANTEQGHKHLLIGFPAIVPARIGKEGLFSHHLYRVRPLATSSVRNQFAYRLLLTPSVREQVIGCSNGTTVNMLKADGLSKPRFVCPPSTLIQEFDELALPIQQKQECNVTQAESLTNLRDTLLPRLMSGKLRIQEVAEVSG